MMYMMFMYDIHALEPWIETNFQCLTLDGTDASYVVTRKARKPFILMGIEALVVVF